MAPPAKSTSRETVEGAKDKKENKKKGPMFVGGNYINVAVLVACAVVFGASWSHLFGSPTLADLDKLHPTLLTPAPEVWYAWIAVFGYEAVFATAQMLPWYSKRSIVVAATPWCVVAWLVQMYFVVETGRDDPTNATFAVIAIIAVLVLMFGLLLTMDQRKPTFTQYWLIRAPFSLHAGWIMVVAVVNVNMYVQYQQFRMPAKFAVSVICLMFMLALTTLFSLTTRRPDPIIAIPVAWGTYWMYQQSLDNAHRGRLLGTDDLGILDYSVIDGVGFAALQVSIGAVWLSGLAFLARFVVCCKNDATTKANKSKAQQEIDAAQRKSVYV